MTMRMSVPIEEIASFPAVSIGGRMRRMARLFFRNLWRSGVMPLMAVIIGIGVWYSRLLIGEGVVLWHEVSLSVAMTYAIVGPLCAAIAAWTAGRAHRRRMEDQLQSTALPDWQQDGLTFATAAGLGIIGYGGMVLIVLGWATTQATWGAPYGVVLLSGMLMVVLFCLFGAAVGMLWPHHLASLLVLALTGGSVVYGNTIENWGIEANARELTLWNTLMSLRDGLSPWQVDRVVPELYKNMLMAMGVSALIVLLTLVIRHRGPVATGTLVIAMVLAAAGVLTSVTGDRSNLVARWMASETTASFEYACSDSGTVEVCLHPAWTSVQPLVEEMATKIYTPITGLEGVPERIIQVSTYDRNEKTNGTFYMPQGRVSGTNLAFFLVSTVFPDLNRDAGSLSDPELVITGWLTQEARGRPMLFIPSGPGNDPTAALRQQEVRAAIDRFAALSPDEQRAWLKANWDALRAGELTLDDLP